MRWRSPAGYTVEVLRLSMTCRRHSQPADPAGDGEQFLVRMPGGRVAEYTKSLSRVQELVPDFAELQTYRPESAAAMSSRMRAGGRCCS